MKTIALAFLGTLLALLLVAAAPKSGIAIFQEGWVSPRATTQVTFRGSRGLLVTCFDGEHDGEETCQFSLDEYAVQQMLDALKESNTTTRFTH